MAIAVSLNTSGGWAASTAQQTFPIVNNVAVGDLVIIIYGIDNAGASGASAAATPTDTKGNTYTSVKTQNRTAGNAANDGCTVAIYKSTITTALTTAASDGFNMNFSPNVARGVAWAYVVTGANTTEYSTDGAGGSGATYTDNATPSMASGDLFIGAVANETATVPVADTDTTNGSWVTDAVASGGTGGDATKMSGRAHYKIVTGAGTQTLNGSTGASTDWAVAHACFTVPSVAFGGQPHVIVGPSQAAQTASRW